MQIIVSSDHYHQIKPHHKSKIEEKITTAGKYAPYLNQRLVYSEDLVIPAYSCITFSNIEVLSILEKAVHIVSNTEAYTEYLLEHNFGEGKGGFLYIPPGTVRIYSQNLICFYNGKTWRKLKP